MSRLIGHAFPNDAAVLRLDNNSVRNSKNAQRLVGSLLKVNADGEFDVFPFDVSDQLVDFLGAGFANRDDLQLVAELFLDLEWSSYLFIPAECSFCH